MLWRRRNQTVMEGEEVWDLLGGTPVRLGFSEVQLHHGGVSSL